jgi:hypothetical protein
LVRRTDILDREKEAGMSSPGEIAIAPYVTPMSCSACLPMREPLGDPFKIGREYFVVFEVQTNGRYQV